MKIQILRLSSLDKEDFFQFIKRQDLEDHFLFTRWKDSINSDEKLKNIIENECNLSEKEGFRIIGKNLDGRICGYGLIDFFSQKEKQHVSVVGTIVDNEFRGQGIGKQLLEEEIQISKSKNKLKIRASAHEHNVSSIKLHQSLGFVEEGKFVAEEFKEKYLNIISMALFLDSKLIK
jgi:RimJ/RimL family protein N-acetyltransferase